MRVKWDYDKTFLKDYKKDGLIELFLELQEKYNKLIIDIDKIEQNIEDLRSILEE